jgi:hypothetical protein
LSISQIFGHQIETKGDQFSLLIAIGTESGEAQLMLYRVGPAGDARRNWYPGDAWTCELQKADRWPEAASTTRCAKRSAWNEPSLSS